MNSKPGRRRKYARVECVECGQIVQLTADGFLERHLVVSMEFQKFKKCEGSGHRPHIRGWEPKPYPQKVAS